jgi:hypothetical protein
MEDVPAITMMSNIPAVYVNVTKIPRPTLLPRDSPKTSINPRATAAIITTHAIPEGTRNVSSKV